MSDLSANTSTADNSEAATRVVKIREEAEQLRTIGSISSVAAIAGGIVVGLISGPIGLAAGAIGAALAAASLIGAEEKESEAKKIEVADE
jgi:hypothetical protein